MENSFKISIPKPCHQDWDQMEPQADGRFCNSCAKYVIDFTAMKADEIRDYFILHQKQRVCGRFQTQQLDSLVISIPRRVLFSQTQFHKMFLLALFVSMGTTLFSCSDGQKIDAVEVVDAESHITTGAPIFNPVDTIETAAVPKKPCIKTNLLTKGEVVLETITGDVDLGETKQDTPAIYSTGVMRIDTIGKK